jgi:hypothetical protein
MVARWTKNEDERLRALRTQGLTYPECAAIIGRPHGSVKTRARQIGAAGAPDRPWSDTEIATLCELHLAGIENAQIAARLGRSKDAVAQRASALKLPRFRRPLEERFWEKVARRALDECWPWLGARDRKGYGAFMMTGEGVRKHRVTASRLAYELAVGPIAEGLAVMHRCDNPPCCNPAHLVAGTIADNNRDMVVKGRHKGFVART